MRFRTTGGQFVSATTKAEAAALAAQYGLGEIAGATPAPASPVKPMSLQTARRMASDANDWPRCGEGWPANAREREATAVLVANGCTVADPWGSE
jgi:hypothetical protein